MGLFSEGQFIRTEPNAFNIFLWRVMVESMAQNLSGVCQNSKLRFELRQEFKNLLIRLCTNSPAMDLDSWLRDVNDLWYGLVGFESQNELAFMIPALAEKDYNTHEITYAKKSGSSRVYILLYSILMSPTFFVEK